LLFFLFVWHLVIYTPVAHITWNARGFFKTNYIEDFSGGLVVHMTAGVSAAAAHVFLDWIQAPKAEPRKPNNPEQLIGVSTALWFLWFGLNAGKAYSAGAVASQSIVNTIAGVTTSVLTNYFLDALLGYPYSHVAITNAILIGLISTSPSTGFVTVGGAMVVTVITVLTVRVLGHYIFKENADDAPYSIATLHGIGGSTAFLFTAMMTYQFINPAGLNGLTQGTDTPIRHHTAAVLAIWTCGFCSILLALVLSNLIVPLSKSKQGQGEFSAVPVGPFGGSPADSAEQPQVETQENVQTA
jgi:ammonium transporter, Amt family